MNIINGHDDFFIKEGCAVTIGKFDGVHIGHQKLIHDVVNRAKVSGIRSCVITFDNPLYFKNDPVTKEVTDSSKEETYDSVKQKSGYIKKEIEIDQKTSEEKSNVTKRLTVFEEKKHLIEQMGVDLLVVFNLDEDFIKLNPYAFIDSVLMDKLNMQSVSIGPDFRFGHKRDGKAMTFVKASMIYGYGVNVIEKEKQNEKEVSSTLIRTKLADGDISAANELLGRKYSVSGLTKQGDKIGRKIGFPTMNIYPDEEKLLPPFGVYASEVTIGGNTYKAVTNVGVRPTVSKDESRVSVESHLLDFKNYGKNDYDKMIVVSFIKKIRDEEKFDSEDKLAEQIAEDIETRKTILD